MLVEARMHARLSIATALATLCLGACAGKTPVRIAAGTIAAFGGFAIYHGATMDTTGATFDDAFAKGSQQELCVIGGALIAGLASAVLVENELHDPADAPGTRSAP